MKGGPSLRVISGMAKGRHLYAPKGHFTRPTADRVKEALFSVLAPYISGSRILDAFAGTGALGIEALSRGAEFAVFMEKNRTTCNILEKNLQITGLSPDKVKVFCADCLKIIPVLTQKFDIVFLDPPYNQGYLKKTISLILESDILEADSILVVEISAKDREDFIVPGLEVKKISVYGDTSIVYCRKVEGSFERG